MNVGLNDVFSLRVFRLFKEECHLSDALKLGFPFINSVSDDKNVLQCSVCSSTFKIASGGRTAITEHLQAQKHKNAMVAKSLSGSLTNYFRKL